MKKTNLNDKCVGLFFNTENREKRAEILGILKKNGCQKIITIDNHVKLLELIEQNPPELRPDLILTETSTLNEITKINVIEKIKEADILPMIINYENIDSFMEKPGSMLEKIENSMKKDSMDFIWVDYGDENLAQKQKNEGWFINSIHRLFAKDCQKV